MIECETTIKFKLFEAIREGVVNNGLIEVFTKKKKKNHQNHQNNDIIGIIIVVTILMMFFILRFFLGKNSQKLPTV